MKFILRQFFIKYYIHFGFSVCMSCSPLFTSCFFLCSLGWRRSRSICESSYCSLIVLLLSKDLVSNAHCISFSYVSIVELGIWIVSLRVLLNYLLVIIDSGLVGPLVESCFNLSYLFFFNLCKIMCYSRSLSPLYERAELICKISNNLN